jgi:membrane-associated protease RseP (regulator of RpoE activity)
LRGAGVCVPTHQVFGLIVSSRDVIFEKGEPCSTVIVACGSVALNRGANHVLIVSGGDVTVPHRLSYSVIVARGNVTIPHRIHYSSIFAGGSVTATVPGPGGRQATTRTRETNYSLIREHDTEGLGIIRFFDERKLGVEVLPNKTGVLVKETLPGRPYAAAGLRAGDVISAIDGVAIASPESFRTTLRQRLAEGNRFLKLSVQRAGEKLELRVPRAD